MSKFLFLAVVVSLCLIVGVSADDALLRSRKFICDTCKSIVGGAQKSIPQLAKLLELLCKRGLGDGPLDKCMEKVREAESLSIVSPARICQKFGICRKESGPPIGFDSLKLV